MKETFLRFLKPRTWLFFHLGILVLLGFSVFTAGPVSINSLLMDMLPQSGHSRGVIEADNILGEKNSREAIIFSAAEDFNNAKEGAVFLHSIFSNSAKVESISLFFDSSVISQITDYFYDYRFVIASEETLRLLETGMAQEIAYDALASAFGAFNFTPLENIEKDPFLLTERQIKSFLSSSVLSQGNLGLKEDVLAANIDGTWYVMLRMTLAPHAISIGTGTNIVKDIYSAAQEAKNTIQEIEFYFSGVPFHSYESSSNAQKEITLITTIALIIIFLLFLYIFRSPLPVFLSMLAAVVSLATATAAALLIFREIHIITFVFGTTVIGTCVDYSIHYFIHWKGNAALKDGKAIRRRIIKSITMCFISTGICFLAVFFAPFSILKQFAVFSVTGLFSSFLTACCLYPYLKIPQDDKRNLLFFSGRFFLLLKKVTMAPKAKIAVFASLAVCSTAILLFHPHGIKIKNDITTLYTMSKSMLESEKRVAMVLDYGASFWYYIVSGSNPQETLQNEELLLLRLEEEIAQGNLDSFLGTSVFVPSINTQRKTYEAMKALIPFTQAQYEYLGFSSDYAGMFYDEFAAAAARFALPENVPANLGAGNLWIGKAGSNYYSCILPLNPKDEAVFRSIAEELDFVYFISKANDINRDLDTITKTILYFFLAAYIIVSVIICFVYPIWDSLKICATPFFLVLFSLAVLTLNNIPLGFFSIAGLVMVFGLGLDFSIYMIGRKQSTDNGPPLTQLAVTLSFLTSFLSFGVLGLSSFMPVYIFGLTVSSGLLAAFISAMLLTGRES